MRAGVPTAGDVEAFAVLDGIELDDGEAIELLPVVAALVASASIVEDLKAPFPAPRHGRVLAAIVRLLRKTWSSRSRHAGRSLPSPVASGR